MSCPAPLHILLTGASSGIGAQAALRLGHLGHRLTLPCRDAVTAASTLERLTAAGCPTGSCSAPICDLADLESVKRCASDLLAQGELIDSLVLNAGLQYSGAPAPRRSAQGFELTLAVNHLAHQALAQRLLPLLEGSSAPRVVVTASEVHDPASSGGRVGPPAGLGRLAGLRPDSPCGMVDGQGPFNAEKAYKDSKLCNLLFARELARRLDLWGTPMPVLAWSPGLVIPRGSGGFFRDSQRLNPWGQRLFALVARDLLRLTASPEQAGRLLADLASAPLLPGEDPGFQYRSNRVLGPGQLCFELAQPSAEACDDALALELWERSAALVGLGPDLISA
jgi:protochlorophyllide reductase